MAACQILSIACQNLPNAGSRKNSDSERTKEKSRGKATGTQCGNFVGQGLATPKAAEKHPDE